METIKEIFLLGVGHNTPVFIELAEHCGYTVAGLYHYKDGRTGEMEHGFRIVGTFNDLFSQDDLSGINFLLTMGDNKIRVEVAKKLRDRGGNVPALVHPTAVVSRFAQLADGVTICAFSYIQADTCIGQDTIILSGVNISHNNSIGKGCFVAGGATVGAFTNVGNFVFIGQGVLTISSKVKNIGNYAYIGAGSMVTKSINPHETVVGRPAKIIKRRLIRFMRAWRDGLSKIII
jgi:sugar O-acyltransferase (sialic acid O-acetyltransferase NeuD family)